METDWREISLIYESLQRIAPNPVIELNRLVASSHADTPLNVLHKLAELEKELFRYQPYHAAKADLLARSGDVERSGKAFNVAISLSTSEAERKFLRKKRDRC